MVSLRVAIIKCATQILVNNQISILRSQYVPPFHKQWTSRITVISPIVVANCCRCEHACLLTKFIPLMHLSKMDVGLYEVKPSRPVSFSGILHANARKVKNPLQPLGIHITCFLVMAIMTYVTFAYNINHIGITNHMNNLRLRAQISRTQVVDNVKQRKYLEQHSVHGSQQFGKHVVVTSSVVITLIGNVTYDRE